MVGVVMGGAPWWVQVQPLTKGVWLRHRPADQDTPDRGHTRQRIPQQDHQ